MPQPTTQTSKRPATEDFIAAWNQYGSLSRTARTRALAELYSIDERTVRRWRRWFFGESPKKVTPIASNKHVEDVGVKIPKGAPIQETVHTKDGMTERFLTTKRITTKDELVAHLKPDLVKYDIEKWGCRAWEGYIKNSDGEVELTPTMFSVFVDLKANKSREAMLSEVESLKHQVKCVARPFRYVPRAATNAEHMMLLSIPDLHVGKLAWGKETGFADYDSRIAEEIYEVAVTDLLEKLSHHQFEEVVIVIGNDLMNSDNREGFTTGGTQQRNDSRYQKSMQIVRRMMTRTIETARQIAPVRAVIVPGNHDALTMWHLGESLECTFDKVPDIVVDNEPNLIKFHRYGENLQMYLHGNRGKRDDYPLYMSTTRKEDWGQTTFREIFTGHLHQVGLLEKHGVRVRTLPSLSAADDWHAENLFIGNIRSAEAYVYHKRNGMVGFAAYNHPEEVQKAAA